MNFLRQIEEIDQLVDTKKEEEYRKTLFDSSASSAGLGFAASYMINGQPFSIIGSDGNYLVNGQPLTITGGVL